MTDLQTSLIAIGGAIVAGVIGYNKWQEYKAKKSVERAFSSTSDDVLMTPSSRSDTPAPARQEPGFFAAEPDVASTPDGIVTSDDAPLPEGAAASAETVATARPMVRNLPVDDLVDCLIPLTLENPLRGDKILGPIHNLRHVGSKAVHYIGLREGGDWEAITHANVYTALQAGVQLANRATALNEIEYSELIMSLRAVADELGAEPDVPDMTHVMQSARALHQFISEFDAQLSVNIQSNGAPWAINTLLTALEKQGFDLRPEGRLVMSDGEGGVLFSLSTNVTLAADTTSRLTLLLDVPRVAPGHNAFGALVACARSLALRMDGTVVDDGNQPLSDQALSEIASQVDDFYANMESADIPAGSMRALRLFS
ncbi:cell division protein ZipA C-terminal FtsZ-binding domain-containing protein [Actimicrobium antarcticum]|uniref:Cell division protein ZipA n=1 Tax=Actimicrobium antarcticum TaxID=1051899 RepID=A0ABP7TR00_9BURK